MRVEWRGNTGNGEARYESMVAFEEAGISGTYREGLVREASQKGEN